MNTGLSEAAPFNIQAFRLAVLDAWKECRITASREAQTSNPAFATTDVEPMLRKVFDDTVRAAACAHNALQPSATLPAEILTETLLLVPVANRVDASAVCKHWYRIVRSSPHLWTSIVFVDDTTVDSIHSVRHIESVRAMLELSCSNIVRLDITMRTEEQCVKLSAVLQTVLGRCVDFRLAVEMASFSQASREALQRLLATPAPRIALLSIYQEGIELMFSLDSTFRLFSDDSPELRYLEYKGDIALLLRSSVAVSNLVAAHISYTYIMNPPLLSSLLQLLKSCKDVTLGIMDWDDDRNFGPIQVPDGIQRLHLGADFEFSANPSIINQLSLPVTKKQVLGLTFEAAYNGGDDLVATSMFRSLIELPTTSTSVHSASLDKTLRCASFYWAPEDDPPESGINILVFPVDEEMHMSSPFAPFAWSESSKRLEIYGERRAWSYHGSLQIELFANLTRLYVSESVFDPVLLPSALPSFPNLVHLLIWPMPDCFHRMGRGDSVFVSTSPHPPPRILHCLSLKFLTFLADVSDWCDGARPRLTPDMVSSFVRERLRFGTARLERISMLGVELLVYDPTHFEDMMDITEEVVYDERATTWVVNMPLIEVSQWA